MHFAVFTILIGSISPVFQALIKTFKIEGIRLCSAEIRYLRVRRVNTKTKYKIKNRAGYIPDAVCDQKESRTPIPERALPPQSSVSTNSTTWP